MRASGNGDVQVCANNLLLTVRGEVPYDRIRGVGANTTDMPYEEGVAQLIQDAKWTLDTYEPRGDVQEITVEQDEATGGDFFITARCISEQ